MEKIFGLPRKGHYDNGHDLRDNSMNSKEEGVPFLGIREISSLKELQHDNVVGVVEVFYTESGFYLVSELMRCDLSSTLISGKSDELAPLLIKVPYRTPAIDVAVSLPRQGNLNLSCLF